ncbi:MAG: LLM class flavin-dependent oxidoreductase [Acidimicrobiales bacterium]
MCSITHGEILTAAQWRRELVPPMDLGLMIFPTDQTIDPVELGREADERGFESLWFPEHSHIPVARTTPWGGRDGAPPLPDHYWRSYDQFVALAAVAATTTNLKVATGITLVAQRSHCGWPKRWRRSIGCRMVASCWASATAGTRRSWRITAWPTPIAEPGFVIGHSVEELWTNDEAAFGDHISFDASWAWPKPVQTPIRRVILGGSAGRRPQRTSRVL